MTANECRRIVDASLIKVHEGKRSAVFQNPQHEAFIVTQVDGCLLKNTIAADWVVSKKNFGDLVVELKGVDVGHAFEQIYATAEYWNNDHSLKNGKLAGLIVCRQFPRTNSSIQRNALKFARKFKGHIHIEAKNIQYVFDKLFVVGAA